MMGFGAGPLRSARTREGRLGLTLATPILIVMGALVFLPLVITVVDSFYRVEPMRAGKPFVGFANYTGLLTNSAVPTAWGNTVV